VAGGLGIAGLCANAESVKMHVARQACSVRDTFMVSLSERGGGIIRRVAPTNTARKNRAHSWARF